MLCGRLGCSGGHKQLFLGRRVWREAIAECSTRTRLGSGNFLKFERSKSSILLQVSKTGVKSGMASAEVGGTGLESRDDGVVAAESNGAVVAPQPSRRSDVAAPRADDGFSRQEMNSQSLVGSVGYYERHVFLCYKEPESWPAQIDAADFDRLPRHLVAALRARKNDMPKKTRLTICEGRDGPDSSSGDVLIFPEMLLYRGLTHFDVDSFVEDTLVKEEEWVGCKPEPLSGSHIFVCAHASRDARCGSCGPVLMEKLDEEIKLRKLESQIFVRPCSHIGGHKYAGNLIVFSANETGTVSGHWYGYVTPADIPLILDQHISKGEIIDRLWRGQMGINEAAQKQAQQKRLSGPKEEDNGCGCNENADDSKAENGNACCQTPEETVRLNGPVGQLTPTYSMGIRDGHLLFPLSDDSDSDGEPTQFRIKIWGSHYITFPKWTESWEREDTFAALAVLGAAATVVYAVHVFRHSK